MDDDQTLLLMVAKTHPELVSINEIRMENGGFSFATGLMWATNHKIKLTDKVMKTSKRSKFRLFRKQFGWGGVCFHYARKQFNRFRKIIIE